MKHKMAFISISMTLLMLLTTFTSASYIKEAEENIYYNLLDYEAATSITTTPDAVSIQEAISILEELKQSNKNPEIQALTSDCIAIISTIYSKEIGIENDMIIPEGFSAECLGLAAAIIAASIGYSYNTHKCNTAKPGYEDGSCFLASLFLTELLLLVKEYKDAGCGLFSANYYSDTYTTNNGISTCSLCSQ